MTTRRRVRDSSWQSSSDSAQATRVIPPQGAYGLGPSSGQGSGGSKVIERIFCVFVTSLLIAGSAGAADVNYVLQTPGVV